MASKIIYKDFVLYPSDNAIGRFDLWRTVIRTKKDSNETYEAEEEVGYGMTLNRCMEKIAFFRAKNSIKEESVPLKEYIDTLINELETIKKELVL